LNVVSKITHHFKIESVNELEEQAKIWIKDTIEKKVIKSIAWSEFSLDSIKNVGQGNFGSVYRAYWTNNHNYVACKKLAISSDIQYKRWEAFRHELHMQNRVHSCENIIRILGISKSKSFLINIICTIYTIICIKKKKIFFNRF
jgi:hypothetical protein